MPPAYAAILARSALLLAANDDNLQSPKLALAMRLLLDATAILDELTIEEGDVPLDKRFAIVAAAYAAQSVEILMTQMPPCELQH